MKLTTIFLLFLFMTILFSCEKEDGLLDATGRLKNLTGLDGCGWVIEVDKNDGTTTLNPKNLRDFNVTLQEGQEVTLSFYLTPDPNICMVGEVITLTAVKDK